jgi:hypothetical protein
MISHYQPRQLIEVGSGNCSLVSAAALKMNARNELNAKAVYTIVAPYPGDRFSRGLPMLDRLV